MSSFTRTIAEVAVCATLGSAFAFGCYVATTPDSKPAEFGMTTTADESTWRALTSEQVDVLAEGDEPDRRWETCEINTDLAIYCADDNTWHTYPAPEPDGSEYALHAHDDMLDLDVCEDKAGADLPCRVDMAETYVVGGDGTVHDGCTVVLLNDEDSEMVCTDDTVWAS